ncbi:arylsulfatase [Nubsella zeaxanthinifaciens]|uniref:arylsulfatase n=1 Tax=Nubsella zeaxanthinifaciens TaxID=392412 RepID=UPI003D02FC8B
MKKVFLALLMLAFGSAKAQNKPNIVVVLADDMGYSDLSCYGSEIKTPNIDAIAKSGVRLKQFYNTGRCCPTRASLLTGQYAHNTGLGFMTGFDQNSYGYRGEINKNCVTIAEALKPAGYKSYASGKWHVCANIKPKGDKNNWPLQRGFDGYFGILQGSASYFTPKTLTSGNKPLKIEQGFYLTDAIADSAVHFISQQNTKKSPFFLYVAYTAPHWPLHAKEADVKKYMSVYEKGWDKLREERYERQKKHGLVGDDIKLSPKDTIPSWDNIPVKDRAMWVKRMAIYAAQVDCMDKGVGRITDMLKKKGLYDNTIVVFMSDNGACAEYLSRSTPALETIGTDDSYESYRGYWANLSNTPYKEYKTRSYEGGIKTSFIVSWPNQIKNTGVILNNNQPAHVIDLMPTFLSVAGVKYPTIYNGNTINKVNGQDILPLLMGKTIPQRTLYWEHEGNMAILDNQWKLVSKSTEELPYQGAWELYNLKNDGSELNNLASKNPQKVKELEAKWIAWAKANNVYPINGTSMKKRGETFAREH